MQFEPPDVKRDRWGKSSGDMLRELLAEQGIVEFSTFENIAEGKDMPTGLETESWMVLTKDEKVYDIFLDWDEEKVAPDGSKGYYYIHPLHSRHPLQERERSLEPYWHDEPRYISARRKLNLPLTQEQEEILQRWEQKWQEENHS